MCGRARCLWSELGLGFRNREALQASPVTSPVTSPITSPVTSSVTSSVTSPVTSPVTGPGKDLDYGVAVTGHGCLETAVADGGRRLLLVQVAVHEAEATDRPCD